MLRNGNRNQPSYCSSSPNPIIKKYSEVLKMYDREYDPELFIITHKEQELLKRLRELSDEDRTEIENLTLDLALKDIQDK